MESLKTPRFPTIRPVLDLGGATINGGQLDGKSKIRTFLIDTPLDEALSERERLWSFQQKNRGASGKGNFLPNVAFRNKIYSDTEGAGGQEKVEHMLPKIGIIEGEKVNKPRRSMIVRPRLRTRYDFYIPFISTQPDSGTGRFVFEGGEKYGDSVNQMEISSEEYASKNAIDNTTDGIVSSRQTTSKCSQRAIKQGVHYGGGFCNSQESRLPEMTKSWTTLATGDVKKTPIKSTVNRRHYCSLTGLNSPEPQEESQNLRKISTVETEVDSTKSRVKIAREKETEENDELLKIDKSKIKTDVLTNDNVINSGPIATNRNEVLRNKDKAVMRKSRTGQEDNIKIVSLTPRQKHEPSEVEHQLLPTDDRIIERKDSLRTADGANNPNDLNDETDTSSGINDSYDDESEKVNVSNSENDETDTDTKSPEIIKDEEKVVPVSKIEVPQNLKTPMLTRGVSDVKINKKEERPVSFRSNSDMSMDWPKDRLGHTTHTVDRKGLPRKGSWQYGHPYRWTDKHVTESDKGWIEKVLHRHTVIDETNYNNFARTKPVQLPKLVDRERSFIHSRQMK